MRLPSVAALVLGAHRHRDERAQLEALGAHAARVQPRRAARRDDASTTSLTVPPNAFLTALKSASSHAHAAKRRCGPISTFSGVGGAGFSAAQTISPMPSARLARLAERALGRRSAATRRAPRRRRAPCAQRRATPAASELDAASARARGCHGSSGCVDLGAASGARSNSTVARSTPAMPSISAWWVLEISAEAAVVEALDEPHLPQRLGAVELLGEDPRGEVAAAAPRCPGAGSAVWRTWYSRLKSGSSTHSGRPRLGGRERELLAVARHEVQAPADRVEEVVVRRRRALERSTSAPMCMCETGPSWCRNEASIASAGRGVALGIAAAETVHALAPYGSQSAMAWDFSTDPEFQAQLDWMAAFVREEIWPLETLDLDAGAARPRAARRCRSRSRSAGCGPRTCRPSSAARASARSSSG